jgi:hypothetical protein
MTILSMQHINNNDHTINNALNDHTINNSINDHTIIDHGINDFALIDSPTPSSTTPSATPPSIIIRGKPQALRHLGGIVWRPIRVKLAVKKKINKRG